jgi:hypothetical protein
MVGRIILERYGKMRRIGNNYISLLDDPPSSCAGSILWRFLIWALS